MALVSTAIKKGHIKHLDDQLNKIFNNHICCDRTKMRYRKRSLYINLSGKSNNLDHYVNIYTDGSKQESKVGFGWTATVKDFELISKHYKLDNKITVYQAELLAIMKALEWIKEDNKHKKYAIYVDSKSALQSLNKNKSRSKIIQSIWDTLSTITNKVIQFYWIKGHNNNTGNEFADMLAKQGTKYGQKIHTHLNMRAIKNSIDEYIDQLWNKQWQQSTKTMHTKQIIQKNKKSKNLTKLILTKSKYEVKNLVEWITGHGSLNKNLFYLGHSDTKKCRICETEDETPFHIMMSCPGTEIIRVQEILLNNNKTIKCTNNKYEWSNGNLSTDKINYILKTIKETRNRFSWELRIGN